MCNFFLGPGSRRSTDAKKPRRAGLVLGWGDSVGRWRRVGRPGYSRPSSASVSCSVLMSRSTSSGGISTQVVETGRPADVLAVCLSPMSVRPPSTRVNWSRGAGVMAPSWHEKARSGRALISASAAESGGGWRQREKRKARTSAGLGEILPSPKGLVEISEILSPTGRPWSRSNLTWPARQRRRLDLQ